MHVQSEAVPKTILHDIGVAFNLITVCVYYATKTVHLQLEEIRQYIQGDNSNYLVKIITPNIYRLGTGDETINYIAALL